MQLIQECKIISSQAEDIIGLCRLYHVLDIPLAPTCGYRPIHVPFEITRIPIEIANWYRARCRVNQEWKLANLVTDGYSCTLQFRKQISAVRKKKNESVEKVKEILQQKKTCIVAGVDPGLVNLVTATKCQVNLETGEKTFLESMRITRNHLHSFLRTTAKRKKMQLTKQYAPRIQYYEERLRGNPIDPKTVQEAYDTLFHFYKRYRNDKFDEYQRRKQFIAMGANQLCRGGVDLFCWGNAKFKGIDYMFQNQVRTRSIPIVLVDERNTSKNCHMHQQRAMFPVYRCEEQQGDIPLPKDHELIEQQCITRGHEKCNSVLPNGEQFSCKVFITS
jgi:hypothetical protein